MKSFHDVWASVCGFCRQQISEVAYNSWIKPLSPVSLADGEVVLSANTIFQKNIVEENYTVLLKHAFEEIMGFPVTIRVIHQDENAIVPEPEKEKPDSSALYTFDTFVVGPSNRFAHAAAVAVATNPGGTYNPLFIYGNSGLGKTHLLNAIRTDISLNFANKTILYTRGEEFTNELISSISRGSTPAFRDKYRKADALFIDDIHFIAGKESTQEEFFNTFNALHQENRQIVVTSDRPPKEIQTLDERIRSRFEMGLLADIQQPDFETRVTIIRKKAQHIGFDLPEDIIQFIANHIKNNVRQLEGTVKKLHAFSSLTGEKPNIANTMSAISDIRNDDQPVPVTIERIVNEVARTYDVSAEDIYSQKRDKEISGARHIAVYITREITQLALESIGKAFGGRDHSTIHYSISKVEKEMRRNSHEKATIEDIVNNITNR